MSRHHHRLFLPLIVVGGLIFGFGLGFSHMARPEVVIDFLTFEDFGLLFVMFGGSIVAGLAFWMLSSTGGSAPLTGRAYTRRLKPFDRNVLVGGSVFGDGWGLSGICPGAAYASLGVGNWPILYALAGMFVGAYAHGAWGSEPAAKTAGVPSDD